MTSLTNRKEKEAPLVWLATNLHCFENLFAGMFCSVGYAAPHGQQF
jgi:hypothetical protein